MKIPIQLPNPPMGFKAEAFIVETRKPRSGDWFLSNTENAEYTDQNFMEISRPILQLQKIEAPKPKIKATGIKQWSPRTMTFECTCCGARDDIEIPMTNERVDCSDWDLSKVVSASSLAPKCKNLEPVIKERMSDLMVTYGADMLISIERQAKIEVLKEVLADDSCDTCHWYGVITEMLEQLEVDQGTLKSDHSPLYDPPKQS